MARTAKKDNTRVAVDFKKFPKALKLWHAFCQKKPWLTTNAARLMFLLENHPEKGKE
jgi:hypothetical protein